MTKTFWITDSRFKFIAIILLIMFMVFMALIYSKADEVTRDPCSICSERMGQEVMCTTIGYQPITRTYFPDGSIEDVRT